METVLAALIDEKYIQFGFAGFAVILLGIIVWMIRINGTQHKALVHVIEKNNTVLAKVIDAIKSVDRNEQELRFSVDKLEKTMDDLHKHMLSRPCIHRGN